MITLGLRRLCQVIDYVVMTAGKLAGYLMPALAVVVIFEVFSRYFLGRPTIWAYDTSLFLFGYIAALGGAYAHQKKAHINVDILYLKVSPNTRRVFNLVSYALGIFFLLLVCKMSFGKYQEAIEFNYRRQGEWAPPMFHFWIMLMIATSLFIAQLGRDMVSDLYQLLSGQELVPSKGDADDEH
jgi:TRAP-type C4-dicarboxylate transport system permease small subunit